LEDYYKFLELEKGNYFRFLESKNFTSAEEFFVEIKKLSDEVVQNRFGLVIVILDSWERMNLFPTYHSKYFCNVTGKELEKSAHESLEETEYTEVFGALHSHYSKNLTTSNLERIVLEFRPEGYCLDVIKEKYNNTAFLENFWEEEINEKLSSI
jgi:hypothetical protein